MRDHATFEARLADAVDRYAAGAPTAVDARALTLSLAGTRAARPSIVDRWTAVLRLRRVAPVLLLLLLALATAVVGALALRLLDRESRVFGAFESVRGWTPGSFEDAVALVDGRLLVVEGADGGATLYDPRTGSAEPVGPLAPHRSMARLVALADGRALVLGGRVDGEGFEYVDLQTAAVFDPATGAFSATGPTAEVRRFPATALLPDGRVLVVGGEGAVNDRDNPAARSAEVFDPGTGTFAPTGNPSVARAGGAAITLADGRVLVAGGSSLDGENGFLPTAAAEIYDPATGGFTSTGSMTTARADHALVRLPDGRVLVSGGRDEDGELRTAELFDPSTGTFAATGALTTERSSHAATALPDGRVLVTGGLNADGEPRTAEVYDPATGRFELAGTASAGSWRAAAQPDGTVVVLGWAQPERWHSIEPLAPPPVPTPAPGFVATGSPAVDRLDHTATLLNDGRVLVAGGRTRDPVNGQSPPVAQRSAEVFDPASGRFAGVGEMARPRSGHAAVRLADGRVLLVGGEPPSDLTGSELPLTAEAFDPASDRFALLDGRIAWNRTGCTVELVALRDGRALLFASCPAGDATQVFDPVAGWGEPRPFDPVGCGGGGPIGDGPHVLAAGGVVVVLCPGNGGAAYLVDPDDGAADPLDPVVPEPSWITGAAALPDGRVLVVTERDARILDPATGTTTPSGLLTDHRAGGRVTALSDGRVLITGGRPATTSGQGYGGPPLPAAETWDPVAGLRLVGPMAAARAGHTATALLDGRVLLVGGVERSPDRTDPVPPGAEIVDPAAVP